MILFWHEIQQLHTAPFSLDGMYPLSTSANGIRRPPDSCTVLRNDAHDVYIPKVTCKFATIELHGYYLRLLIFWLVSPWLSISFLEIGQLVGLLIEQVPES